MYCVTFSTFITTLYNILKDTLTFTYSYNKNIYCSLFSTVIALYNIFEGALTFLSS